MQTPGAIIGFGASSMAGAVDSEGGFFRRVQRILEADLPAEAFINHGVGGNCTPDMLVRCQAVAQAAPHAMIVLLGCNDLPRTPDNRPDRRTAYDAYCANVRTLLTTLHAPHSLFITSFPVSWEKTGIAPETFDRYMRSAAQVAQDCGYAVWDLYGELRGSDRLQQLWAPDGVHFNDQGHALIAAGLADWLREHVVPTWR